MKFVDLDVERLRELYVYDEDTGNLYSRVADGNIDPQPLRASNSGYIVLSIDKRLVMAHRVVWAIYYGEVPPEFIDHIDRDTSNNRISNLRRATKSQNGMNRQAYGEVPAKGVILTPNKRLYMARITANRKTKYLGLFKTVDEAAHAYNKAAIEVHGEFAVLNPIGVDK